MITWAVRVLVSFVHLSSFMLFDSDIDWSLLKAREAGLWVWFIACCLLLLAVCLRKCWGFGTVCWDRLEFLTISRLGSELELLKSKCSKKQKMVIASPIEDYVYNLHSAISAACCWSKQSQNPQGLDLSVDGLLQNHVAGKLVAWEILLWPTLENIL